MRRGVRTIGCRAGMVALAVTALQERRWYSSGSWRIQRCGPAPDATNVLGTRSWRSRAQCLLCTTRLQSTHDGSEHESSAQEKVVNAANWRSDAFAERLGFPAGSSVTEEALKEHFYILAKHYHPDSSSEGTDTAAAFANIKEAYDALLKKAKAGQHGGGNANDDGGSSAYADEALRRTRMRALGDGVMFFMVATFLYIAVICWHNKKRLNSRYLMHLVGILFLIQVFPRLLAAAVLFAAHTTYLIQTAELKEQAAVTVIVRQGDGRGTDKGLHICLDGLSPEAAKNVVVQVETTVAQESAATASSPLRPHSTTLTFDQGVTNFSLPLPPKGREKTARYRITAVDQARQFTVVDKEFGSQ